MAFVETERGVFGIGYESLRIFALCLAIFFVPLLISQQLVTGTLVNAMLIYSALKVKGNWSYLPAMMPSVAAMLAGMLFGVSHAVLLMLPFIWLGNMALIFLMKKIGNERYWNGLAVSALVKTAMLSASVLALVNFAGLPSALIQSFTYLQLITAISGGILALIAMERM